VKLKRKKLQMLFFFILHTHKYNQILVLHIDTFVHTFVLIHTTWYI
jgi:hypothetical protein